jgi:hypothetical protein
MKSRFNKLDSFKTIEESWEIYKNNFTGPFLVCLIPIAVWVVFQIINLFLGDSNAFLEASHSQNIFKEVSLILLKHSIFMIINGIVSLIVTISLLDYFIRLIRNYKQEKVSFKFVFDIRILHAFLFNLLFYALIFLISIVIVAPVIVTFTLIIQKLDIPTLILISLPVILIYIGIMVYISLTLYFSIYMIIDKKHNAIEAFSESIAVSKGNKLQILVLLVLIPLLMIIVTICTLGIGLLFFIPFSYIVFVKAYLNIVDNTSNSEDSEILDIEEYEDISNAELL